MSQFTEDSFKGWVAGTALGDGVAVKLSGTTVIAATAGTDKIVGVVVGATESGEVANVRLRSACGTSKGRAGGNIAIGAAVTATTGGELITTTTAGDQIVGYALEAASDNDQFEFMPSTGKY